MISLGLASRPSEHLDFSTRADKERLGSPLPARSSIPSNPALRLPVFSIPLQFPACEPTFLPDPLHRLRRCDSLRPYPTRKGRLVKALEPVPRPISRNSIHTGNRRAHIGPPAPKSAGGELGKLSRSPNSPWDCMSCRTPAALVKSSVILNVGTG